jgi:signal recognition particle receptor subunit beta
MEWRILFLGSVGAGKTQAIKTISDIEVLSTEELATDATSRIKANTTVAMDMGLVQLGSEGQVILYGAPGQERFSFMWEILLGQTQGIVILVNHGHPNPLGALQHYVEALRRLSAGSPPPFVVGVTHTDQVPCSDLDVYHQCLQKIAQDAGGSKIPVFRIDARKKRDVRTSLIALTAMLEFDTASRQRVR